VLVKNILQQCSQSTNGEIMSIFKEITKEIQNKSKHIEMIKTVVNFRQIEGLSGGANINDMNVREVSQMLLILRTELNQENKLRLKEANGEMSFMDSDYNYSNASSYDLAPYPLMARFLNTLDKDGEALKPLLEKLRSNSGENLADEIFKEIVPIHQNWVETYLNADPYLKLQLNHVDVEEIESLKNLVKFGMFKSITKSSGYLFIPETYTLPVQSFRSTKHDIANEIFRDYVYEIVMGIELGDGLHIASNGDEFFKVGVNQQDKFIFEKLDTELSINGYSIDFSDTKGNVEKSNEVKTLLHMVFIDSVQTLETKDLVDNDAVMFSMLYLNKKSTNLQNENGERLSCEQSFNILKSLSDDGKNEFNKNFEFSDAARKAIKDFADKIRPDHMVSINHLPMINMLHKIGADKVNTDHLDLWCPISEVNNRSELVKTVSQLVDDYRNQRKETSELLAIAKKLNNEGLLLVESKLHCYGIEPKKFQDDLNKAKKKLLKMK
jgi:hypothetical protein